MVYMDMSRMSDDTRERFLDLVGYEALGQINDFEQEELRQLRRDYSIADR